MIREREREKRITMNKKKTIKNMKMTTRKGKNEILEERTRV